MRKIQLLSLLLFLNCLVGWTQGFISITKDTSVQGKYHLFKGEIYRGGQLPDQVNFILTGGDTILISNLHSIPCAIKEDLNNQKFVYARRVRSTQKVFLDIPEDKIKKDTSWLYDSSGHLLRYFTDTYNTALIDSAALANGFKIVIPETPILHYSSDDLNGLSPYHNGIIISDYLITELPNGLQFAIPKGDESRAYFIAGTNQLAIVDPVQDSAILAKSGINYDGSMWVTGEPGPPFYWVIVILLAIILILGIIAWFLFIEKYPVFAIYDGTSFSSFAAASGTTNKFMIKSNKEFHGVNLEVSSEKNDLKDSLAGEFLLVDEKYGFSMGRISRNYKRPVYCRKNNSQEDMASFCNKLKMREASLKALNQQVARRKKYTVTTDYLIGYTYKNRAPQNLKELLASYELSYTEPAGRQKLPGITQLQRGQSLQPGREEGRLTHIQSGPDSHEKSIASHFDDIWGKISAKFSEMETKLSTLENRINILDDDFKLKNKGKPSLDMSFFKPEAQNATYCLNRLITLEKDIVNFVGQLRSEEIELQYFLNSTVSGFLSKQMTVKEKQAYWRPLLDGIISNSGLAQEDLVYKNLAEDISQFSNPLDKSTYLNRQLFNDLWDGNLSNLLVILEELRNTGSFLRQTFDGNTLSDIKGFAERNIDAVLEIAKSLDLNISYLPLFAQYENYNLRDLDIGIFTSFNYFYNNVREKLDKNHIVQIISYGITSSKTDRSTKTKIKILP